MDVLEAAFISINAERRKKANAFNYYNEHTKTGKLLSMDCSYKFLVDMVLELEGK